MTSYLVVKRMKEDRVFMPGEVLVDPIRADVLMQRGYLTIVPDDYGQKAEAAATAKAEADEAAAAVAEKAAAAAAKEADKEAKRRAKARTQAEELAVAMEVTVEEVLALSDEDYDAGVEAFITNAETETTSGSDDETAEGSETAE